MQVVAHETASGGDALSHIPTRAGTAGVEGEHPPGNTNTHAQLP